jgi:hypothetical protein
MNAVLRRENMENMVFLSGREGGTIRAPRQGLVMKRAEDVTDHTFI